MKQARTRKARNRKTFLRIDPHLRDRLRRLSKLRDGLPMVACVRALVEEALTKGAKP